MAGSMLVALIALALTGCGGGSGGTSATLPVLPSDPGSGTGGAPSVLGTTVTWGDDNRTRTTLTRFSDGTTSTATIDVPPVQSGGNLQTVSGVNATAALVNTYGNGVVQTLQDGSTVLPFTQTVVASKSNTDPNAVVATPSRTLDLRWGAKATPYVMPSANNVSARLKMDTGYYEFYGLLNSWNATVPIGLDVSIPLDKSTTLLQEAWITPEVRNAWAQGWTGKGVRIGVIDDFTPDEFTDFLEVPIDPTCETEPGVTFCLTRSSALFRMTHGDQVSAIAGGSITSLQGAWVAAGNFSTPFDFGLFAGVGDVSITLSAPVHGVAKDAQIHRSDFLTYQRATNGLFSEFKRWGDATDAAGQLYRQLKVINLSLGGTSRNPKQNVAAYQNQLAYANASNVPDAVYVKAAGNSACTASSTDCDPLNAVLFNAANFKNKTLLVGALTQPNGRMASYSNRAGNYAERFVVADGRGIQGTDGSFVEGTSFAAPRVSGYAAILRQKFPNLNAAQTASIILDTAQWQGAWGEKNAANQAVYGQGEASLGRALAPVGALR
jgi:hypothetical protein